jgi:hypothetical protein
MKAYRGSGGIAPHIPDLVTRFMCVASFTPWSLYPKGKSPWYPLYRRLGGLQNRSRHGGKEKNSQPPPGFETPIIQPVPTKSLSKRKVGTTGYKKCTTTKECINAPPQRESFRYSRISLKLGTQFSAFSSSKCALSVGGGGQSW